MLSYFMPLDARTLAIRYGVATTVILMTSLLYSAGSIGAARLISSLFPSPFWLASSIFEPLRIIPILLTHGGGIGYLTIWVASVFQLGFFLGFLRYAVWRFFPGVLQGVPVIGVPAQIDQGELVGMKLRRPWWIVPLFMTFSTVVMAYLIVGGFRYLSGTGGRWNRAESWAQGIEMAGPWPAYVALALSALGIAWGWRYVQRTKLALTDGFGVKYLQADHLLTQRVHALAARLDLPPPAVGLTAQVNAFACGPSPDKAAVIVGVPLAKHLSREELDAVIGHELGHIVSGDMRQMQLAEGFQSMFGNVFGTVTALVGSVAASQVRDRTTAHAIRSGSGILNLLGRYIIAFASELMVKGLSRNREYYADAVGAALTSPQAMASALERIHKIAAKPTDVESAYGYLMFRGSSFGRLFSTHPTMERRQAALEKGTYTRLLPRKASNSA